MATNSLWADILDELPNSDIVKLAKKFPVKGFRPVDSKADQIRRQLAARCATKTAEAQRRAVVSVYHQMIAKNYPSREDIPRITKERIDKARRAAGILPAETTSPPTDVHDQVAQWRQRVLSDMRDLAEHVAALAERIDHVEHTIANQADPPPPIDIAPLQGDVASLGARVSALAVDVHFLTRTSSGGE